MPVLCSRDPQISRTERPKNSYAPKRVRRYAVWPTTEMRQGAVGSGQWAVGSGQWSVAGSTARTGHRPLTTEEKVGSLAAMRHASCVMRHVQPQIVPVVSRGRAPRQARAGGRRRVAQGSTLG